MEMEEIDQKDSAPFDLDYLPFIDDVSFEEWLRCVTDPSGPYPNGISTKEIRALVDEQWRRKCDQSRPIKSYWRYSNQLCEIVHREFKAGKIWRISPGIYKGITKTEMTEKMAPAATAVSQPPRKKRKLTINRNRNVICRVCAKNVSDMSTFLCCKECNTRSHLICLRNRAMLPKDYQATRDFQQLTESLRPFFSKWTCYECKRCVFCDGRTDEVHGNGLLLCDRCDSAEHLKCQIPPPKSIPSAPWYCTQCRKEDETVKNKRKGRDNQADAGLKEQEPDKDTPAKPTICLDRFGLPSLCHNSVLEKYGAEVNKWDIEMTASVFDALDQMEVARVFKDQEMDGAALLLLTRHDVMNRLNLKLGISLKAYRVVSYLQNVCELSRMERRSRDIGQQNLQS